MAPDKDVSKDEVRRALEEGAFDTRRRTRIRSVAEKPWSVFVRDLLIQIAVVFVIAATVFALFHLLGR